MKKLLALCVLSIPTLNLAASEISEKWWNVVGSAQIWTDSGAAGISVACWMGAMGIKFTSLNDELMNFQWALGQDIPMAMVSYGIDGGERGDSIPFTILNGAAYMPVDASSVFIPLLRSLKTGNSISVGFFTTDERTVVHHFTLKGSTAAIKIVEDICG